MAAGRIYWQWIWWDSSCITFLWLSSIIRETFGCFTVSLETPLLSCHKLEKAYSGRREKQQKFPKIVQIHCGFWSGHCACEHHVWSLALLMTPCWLYISTNRRSEIWKEVWNSWTELTAALKWRTEGWVRFDRQMGRWLFLLTEHEEDQPCAEYKWK